jgi:thiamine-monophosphate kinase
VAVGPGDDAVVLADGLVVSTDMAVEGIHFRLDWLSAEEAGYRSAAGAMSDLAAMAADPIGVLASVAAPGDGSVAEELMAGVRALVETFGAALLGGDLARSPGPLVVDVVSLGRASRPLLRSGAQEGDELWVTGVLGGAAAAVALWSAGRPVPAVLRAAFVAPRPRIAEARWLAEAGARAGIDLSDGLAGDAAHVGAASGLAIVLEERALPVHPLLADLALPAEATALDLVLHGGDDYELLVAAEAGRIEAAVSEFEARFGLSLTRVGRLERGSGVYLAPADGAAPVPLARGGYDHFAGVAPS